MPFDVDYWKKNWRRELKKDIDELEKVCPPEAVKSEKK
jgi:hypothetical protein